MEKQGSNQQGTRPEMRNLYYASQQSAQNTVLLLKQALSEKKNKKQKTVQRTSSPGGLWEEAGELGMGVGKRFFKGKRLSKGKDFQSVYIFVPSNFGTVLFLTK